MRFARLALLCTFALLAACSLLLPYDDYDRAFGADANPDTSGEAEAAPPDVASAADGAPDGGPSCVVPEPPACDADIATDPGNCGACGHRCVKPNSACTVGICDVDTAFYFPFVTPVGVALDDKYFYGVGGTGFGNAEGGVARGVKDGTKGDVIALYSKDPRRIALKKDGTYVYWTQFGAIARAPNNTLLDGAANVAEVFVPGQSNPTSIAIDDAYLYWTNPPPDGDVWRASLANPADAHAIVTGANAYGVAVDAQYVYFTSYTQGGSVWRMDKAGGKPVSIADGQSYPSDVFVDGEAIYWTNGSFNGAVMKLVKGTTTPISLVGKRSQPGGVFARDPYVYWYEAGATNKDIYRVGKCGGSPLRLVVGQKVTDLAVEDTNVYWTTGDAVNRVAR